MPIVDVVDLANAKVGEIDLADPEVKIVYARAHWERLLQNVREARYKEALRIVSGRQ